MISGRIRSREGLTATVTLLQPQVFLIYSPFPMSHLILSSTLLLGTAMISPAAVYLNEFMVDNPGRPNDRDALLDMDGKSPAWIELRNNGSAAVALTGWVLTDDPAVPGKSSFAAPVAPATKNNLPGNLLFQPNLGWWA